MDTRSTKRSRDVERAEENPEFGTNRNSLTASHQTLDMDEEESSATHVGNGAQNIDVIVGQEEHEHGGSEYGTKMSNLTMKSQKTSRSIQRRKLEAEMITKQKIDELEIEEMQANLEIEKMKRRKEMIILRQKVFEEDLEMESSRAISAGSSIGKVADFASIKSKDKVQSWFENNTHLETNKIEGIEAVVNKDKLEHSLMHGNITNDITDIFSNVLKKLKHDNVNSIKKIKIDLPEFNGDVEKWPMFIKMYRKSNDIYKYSDEENLLRLQSCIKGKARELVYYMLLDADNVEQILKILELNFGRPEIIINMLIEKARNVPICKTENLPALVSFSNMVNIVVVTRNLKRTEYLKNPQLLSEFVSKIPAYLKMEWGKYIYENCGEC